MEETSADWNYYMNKYEAIRKEITSQLNKCGDFHQFYSRNETRRLALNLERKKNRFREAFQTRFQIESLPNVLTSFENSSCNTYDFIKQYGLSQLLNSHNLTYLRHSTVPNLMYLLTNRNESAKSSIELECYNGLLVDELNNFQVVNWGIPRIQDVLVTESQNYIQSNWEIITVYEKLDGLLVNLYFHNGNWYLSSDVYPDNPQSSISWKHDYSGELRETTVNDMFWKIWNQNQYHLPQNTSRYYIFEMVTNSHRFIVNHPRDDVFLIACRDNTSLKELDITDISKETGLRIPKTYSFKNLEEAISNSKNLNPFQCRGYIFLNNKTYERFTISSQKYISIELGSDFGNVGNLNVMGLVDPKVASELLKFKQEELFIAYYPQAKDFIMDMKKEYDDFCNTVQLFFDHFNKSFPQIDKFCEACNIVPELSTLLRKVRIDGHTSVREYLATLIYKAVGFSKPYQDYLKHKPHLLHTLHSLQHPQ